jgi:hypothetical protein
MLQDLCWFVPVIGVYVHTKVIMPCAFVTRKNVSALVNSGLFDDPRSAIDVAAVFGQWMLPYLPV